jgi:hypothetical protein
MESDEAARVRQGACTTTSLAILRELADDPSVTVRVSLALNPALPPHIGAILAADTDARVRTILSRKLAPLTSELSHEARQRVQKDAVASLTAMVADAALRVRANIALAVRDLADGPREIVLRLAHDPAVMVCEPVIRFSPMLTREDLVTLITSGPPPSTILAVANRPKIGAAVSDAIVDTADTAAIGALLANRTAQIREATLDALAAQSEEQTGWQEPLVHRPHLPPLAQRMLSEIVTGHLLETLAARRDLDPKVGQALRAALLRGPRSAPVLGQAPPGPAASLTAWAAGIRRVGSGGQAANKQAPDPATMRDPRMQDDHPILDALRRDATPAASAMLAERADVPVSVIERACDLRSAKAIVSLAWKAGMSPQTAVVLQTMLARLSPELILRPDPNGEFALSEEEMRWQLSFLGAGEATVQR